MSFAKYFLFVLGAIFIGIQPAPALPPGEGASVVPLELSGPVELASPSSAVSSEEQDKARFAEFEKGLAQTITGVIPRPDNASDILNELFSIVDQGKVLPPAIVEKLIVILEHHQGDLSINTTVANILWQTTKNQGALTSQIISRLKRVILYVASMRTAPNIITPVLRILAYQIQHHPHQTVRIFKELISEEKIEREKTNTPLKNKGLFLLTSISLEIKKHALHVLREYAEEHVLPPALISFLEDLVINHKNNRHLREEAARVLIAGMKDHTLHPRRIVMFLKIINSNRESTFVRSFVMGIFTTVSAHQVLPARVLRSLKDIIGRKKPLSVNKKAILSFIKIVENTPVFHTPDNFKILREVVRNNKNSHAIREASADLLMRLSPEMRNTGSFLARIKRLKHRSQRACERVFGMFR